MSHNFQTKTVIVSKDFHNERLWKYMKNIKKEWTIIFIIKLLRKKSILINNRKGDFDYKLQENDVITYTETIGYKTLNAKIKTFDISKLDKLKVIYEDENIVIVDKEPKWVVQPTTQYFLKNMQNRLLNHLKVDLNKNTWKPKFIHRLDTNTSGLLIGAKNLETFTVLSDGLKNRKINKTYRALVFGHFPNRAIRVVNYLDTRTNIVIAKKTKASFAKESISEIKLIKNNKKTSLVEINLITGRKHQARVHLSSLGFPICGDKKYGTIKVDQDIKKIFPFTCLCAYKVKFNIVDKKLSYLNKKEIFVEKMWFEDPKYMI